MKLQKRLSDYEAGTVMSLEKILWSSLVIIGLFITVDYGLCDEFLCRGNERKNRNEDAGDWSWQSHVVWTLVYVVALALWSLTYTLLEGHLLMSGDFTYVGPGCSRLLTVSRLVSTRDIHSHSTTCHSCPLLNNTDESQGISSEQEQCTSSPTRQRRQITYVSQQDSDSDVRPKALPIALWLHLITLVVALALCWTDMISVLGKGSSADEFLNLTRNGLYCHFGGHDKMAHNMSNEGMSTSIYDTCHQVAIYAWPFLFAYILFVLSSVQFLIMTESAVFTVAVSTIALPLAGIWWSLFRMTASTPGLLEWFPAATGGLVCSVFGLLIVLSGMVLLCKAHFKEFRCG
ncbi:uncharacterized protein LOC110835079 isoform X3 [Zootermopsis nevadensis]|uniref:uncharacterized protein LOC110835079 isoform X3 n=1 Tax=Zootermopsis nevadensis TaxID=136037 RepID=UPI000B8E9520|nr:uncharacterized protein LOC110835079 isoform X3 [Zootermopsis nevadensis]